MVDIKNTESDHILEAEFTGAFTEADMEHFLPVLKKHIAESTRPRMFIIMREFGGWDKLSTFWEDVKLDAKYTGKFDRIAIAGDKKWEAWLAKLASPLMPGELKFFELADTVHARKWLEVE